MPNWKPGDRVKVVDREVTKEDRATSTYYHHLANLTGTVTQFYNKDEVAVRIDPEAFTPIIAEAHKEAVKRMRAKFIDGLSEEQRRKLTKGEKQFSANYVLLLHSDDLAKGPPAPKPVKVAEEEEEEDLTDFDPTSVVQAALYDDPEVATTEAQRRTLAEIEADEAEELKRRMN
jgi:hypothetical protein